MNLKRLSLEAVKNPEILDRYRKLASRQNLCLPNKPPEPGLEEIGNGHGYGYGFGYVDGLGFGDGDRFGFGDG